MIDDDGSTSMEKGPEHSISRSIPRTFSSGSNSGFDCKRFVRMPPKLCSWTSSDTTVPLFVAMYVLYGLE